MLKILFLILLTLTAFIKITYAMEDKEIYSFISKKYNIEINLNDDEFQYFLGSGYIQGLDFPKDILKGMKLLKSSANKGNDYANNALGLIYDIGNEKVKVNKETALKYYQSGAEKGNKFSLYNLSIYYLKGIVVKKDPTKGAELLKLSAMQDYSYAQNDLGLLYERV